jgi:aspartate/methionine/tyrosine aminotransferase
VLFRPYYFSHLVAVQLLGLVPLVLPSCGNTGGPDTAALRAALDAPSSRVRAVALVSPNNPSGLVSSPLDVASLTHLCARAGAWLVADEAYEHILFDEDEDDDEAASAHDEGRTRPFASAGSATCAAALDGATSRPPQSEPHPPPPPPPPQQQQPVVPPPPPPLARAPPAHAHNVISIHSFSKSYGLAGWRVGYLSYPHVLHEAMLKVQDTLPTHTCRASQRLALAAMSDLGPEWVRERVHELRLPRALLWDAAAPFFEATGVRASQPRGAFYYLLPLPEGMDDEDAVALLATKHRLLTLPGSAFGCPGVLRLSYGTLTEPREAEAAAARLKAAARDVVG